jgi:hypothetical protein
MFDKIIKFILDREGGYVNHPADPGGATNRGITQRTYDAWRDKKGLGRQSVKACSMEETLNIYREEYWIDSWTELGFPLAACMCDTAVNMGLGRANKFLGQCNNSYVTYLQLRIARYKEIVANKPSQAVFLEGWMNRVTHLRRFIDEHIQNEPIEKLEDDVYGRARRWQSEQGQEI